MAAPDEGGDGPDGSSLQSVSSLRSRWETMNKPSEPAATPPPVRQPSPSIRPPSVADTRPPRPISTLFEGTEPKAKDGPELSRLKIPAANDSGASAPRSPRVASIPPPVGPKPVKPPAVTIEPPQSPPKSRAYATFSPGGQTNLLNPDAVNSPVSPINGPKTAKIPSRPHSPNIPESRRSPRLGVSSQPPSPPPPRRSAELRREREGKMNPIKLPPPVNPQKNRLSVLGNNAPRLEARSPAVELHSPFNSPPLSASSPENEEPAPVLPTRPVRPQQIQSGPPKSKTLPLQFEPPPVHHVVANKRRDQEANGQARGFITPQLTGERPALPVRPQTVSEAAPAPRRAASSSLMKPPPRPPRPGVITSNVTVDKPAAQPKRVVSTPTTQPQQFAPPPSRTHGRSMTVDRTYEKSTAEFRDPPQRITTTMASVPPTSTSATAVYPDASNTNRRPPFAKQGVHEIQTKYDTRVFDVCGQYVCTIGPLTRVWSLLDGDQLMSFSHGEGVKATAVAFKPALDVQDEGARIWIGNNMGEVLEADVATQSIINKTNVHGRYEIIKIYRHRDEMWTLDESGTLHVWGPNQDGLPYLNNNPTQTYRLPRGHNFSMIVGQELWHATGKEIRVFAPTVDGRTQVQVLVRPMIAEGAGEVVSGTQIRTQPGKVYLGHSDGKVSIWSETDFSCLGVLNVTNYKITALAGVGNKLWAAFNTSNTGKICVYDVETSPWIVKKEWQAHGDPIVKLALDRSGCYALDRLQVISLGVDNSVKCWDGLLQDDFLETEMKSMDTQYCEFNDIKLQVMTWNAGAATPSSLRYSESDANFMQNLLQSGDPPDILVFGLQELVDLEDKAATARRLFKSTKKKDGSTDEERMSHQYRDWRDFLVRSLDDYMPGDCLYHLLQTEMLVGLFTCIFVKSTLRDRISNLNNADVKRGFGGLHGNKGAIVIRFMVDDTSLCFINCHLAAGQSHAQQRHSDIAAIMENPILPAERDTAARIDKYTGGGDGTCVMDHELCLLNGDLNYRIDTMSRDTVVNAVKSRNLQKLLERDQLLVARRRNPAFKLRAFDEMQIQFAPTYKYDVGTDNYDTSEKKRAPAWCDRILHRGGGRIKQLDYRRHEVRVSDHRPVTARFVFTVKSISPKQRAVAWASCQQKLGELREKEAYDEKLNYLQIVCGYDQATSQTLIEQKAARRAHRSPSRLGE